MFKTITKTMLIGAVLTMGLSLVSASYIVTESEEKLIDVAADRIVDIMQDKNIVVLTIYDMLLDYKAQYSLESKQYAILDGLLESVLDSYYQIDDFSACGIYYDGCNECDVTAAYGLTCTEKMCVQYNDPYCVAQRDSEAYVAYIAEIICTNNQGNWLADYQECEGISQQLCEDEGGVFNGCGSACRHDIDAEVCTMQCVPFCSFAQ